ncbi:PTS sugar transporter subunit IIA [Liquorilactobacillus mali]|uniref:PTS system sorbose-specific transporter subunit IIA n=1 Tax=Liquorilactobacillus mali TaxID=1618 RepID=A0A0R2FFG2_9LACO|nr:PTS sugar transporter subunit IIA [Liquorilactobacillus mali]KRN27256.1 PTS system sorbose-specific transporter subunit IIA [Liquorilactobacillus mali]MDN7146476.1 PTS sugar transporter subunit IIA [Liquorilactobacillus mali]
MNIILVGHHEIAVSMKKAVEMIFGKVDDFYPVTFLPKEGLQELTIKLEHTIQKLDKGKEILVIADLFSGTPYNAAATLYLQNKVTDVIAGMSLPICLEVAGQKEGMNTSQLVNYILDNSASYTKVLSEVLNQQKNEEEEFE